MDLQIHPPLPRRKDFRIGILGSGFIVNECHLVSYRKAGFNPVAIASRTRANAAKVAEQHNIPRVFETYEALLDDPGIEVLDIAVPPDAQLGLIQQTCQRRTVKGILAQKPLGMNYREAVEAVRACEAAGIRLAVNQNMRYDQSVRAGKTLLQNGTLGEPVLATIDMRAIPHWMPWQAGLGWVTLRIMSIHHLDTFRFWFGNPERIYCSVRPDPRTKFPHTDGICTYILEYANGLRCVAIDDTWTGPAREGCPGETHIHWRIEGLDGLALGDIGWCKTPYTTPSSIRYATKGMSDFQSPVWPESWFPDAFAGTMGNLLIALETNSEPAISGRDNLKTMALVDAAYLSTVERRSVEVNEITEPAFAPCGESPDLSKLTPRARDILESARRQAERFHHSFVGTEHVLLGIIEVGKGVAINVLRDLGVNLSAVPIEIERQIAPGPGQKVASPLTFTPRVKRVLALAAEESRAMRDSYVGTQHILLGLLREEDGAAALILNQLGAKINRTREQILRELEPKQSRSSPPAEFQ